MAAKDTVLSEYFEFGKVPPCKTPTLEEDESDMQMVASVDAWKHADFLCRNYILNGLTNTLYNVYSPIKTAKEL